MFSRTWEANLLLIIPPEATEAVDIISMEQNVTQSLRPHNGDAFEMIFRMLTRRIHGNKFTKAPTEARKNTVARKVVLEITFDFTLTFSLIHVEFFPS